MSRIDEYPEVKIHIEDFVRRFESDPSLRQFSGEEAAQRHQQFVALTPSESLEDTYTQAAEQAFSRLSTDDRIRLARGVLAYTHGNVEAAGEYVDRSRLAHLVTDAQRQDRVALVSVFTGATDEGGPGAGLGIDSSLAKATLGGIAAFGAKGLLA
jgi:hypothetical protein